MKNVKAGHKQPVVCLDAGHYGKYNRSPAVLEYYESDMNWKLHLLLKVELERYGIKVTLTRSDKDKDLALYNRGAASKDCDLFLSIHSNAVGDDVNESVDYVVVHVQLDGKGNTLGNALAQAIAAAMDTKQTAYINTRKGNNGEYYGVLRGAAAVGTIGMILEHSFHTNTRSTKWLLEESNLEKLAVVEAAEIAAWFGVEKEKPAQTPATAWYRIRKSWDDADSQIAAYVNLDYAKSACPVGYSVYDSEGKAVYTRAASTPASNSFTLTLQELKKGDKGSKVKALQILLIGNGFSCGKSGVDGDFGNDTESAVKAYQKAKGLNENGRADQQTFSSLLG